MLSYWMNEMNCISRITAKEPVLVTDDGIAADSRAERLVQKMLSV